MTPSSTMTPSSPTTLDGPTTSLSMSSVGGGTLAELPSSSATRNGEPAGRKVLEEFLGTYVGTRGESMEYLLSSIDEEFVKIYLIGPDTWEEFNFQAKGVTLRMRRKSCQKMYDRWKDETGLWNRWGPVIVTFTRFEDDHCEIRVALRKGVNGRYA